MRTVELSVFKPTLASGSAFSQSRDPNEHETTSHARSTWSRIPSKEFRIEHYTASQVLCAVKDGVNGAGLGACLVRADRAKAVIKLINK